MPKFLRRRLLVGSMVVGPKGRPLRTLQYLVGGATVTSRGGKQRLNK